MILKKKIIGYKFIKENMKSENGDHEWKIGKWYKEDEIKLCNKGFHACKTPLQSLEYTYGDKWFIVEAKGKFDEEKDDKFVTSEMRLIKEIPIDKVVKKFAIFCAKQCLVNYQKVYPNDKRVSNAIKAAEDYYDGKITLQELQAARSAAESAAESAWSAAESARSAAESARSAARSARSAARSAWSAAESARSAARSAAESAAKEEQNKYLEFLIKSSPKEESGK